MQIYRNSDLWISQLQDWVKDSPAAIVRLSQSEFEALSESRRGLSDFTMARSHTFFERSKVPTICFVFGREKGFRNRRRYEHDICLAGILSSKSRITSLETRIKITRALRLENMGPEQFLQMLEGTVHRRNLDERLTSEGSFTPLSPEMSSVLVAKLAESRANRDTLRVVASGLKRTKRFSGSRALQEDAIHIALQAFGIDADAGASEVTTTDEADSAIMTVPVREDTVIQHDARSVSGFEYVGGDITGRAFFERSNGKLEIITANRQPLEKVFGVDLIYLNLSQRNLVMVQYKMLDRTSSGLNGDWVYRPDDDLSAEMKRMESFNKIATATLRDYRLNSGAFYLKFVKRNGLLTNGSILTPLDHFKQYIASSKAKGSRGGVRVSYESLNGSYMRNGTFVDLMQAGYIGSHADDTTSFQRLIQSVLRSNRSVVAAIERSVASNDQAQPNRRFRQ